MKDWYEELARLVGRSMADEWMKIIARRRTKAEKETCSQDQPTQGKRAEPRPHQDEDRRESSI